MTNLIKSVIELKSIADKNLDIKAVEAELQQKAELEAQTKANEIMNTWATGYGAELIPTNVTADPLLDMLGQYSWLLPLLPGNHGNNMAISEKVPVIGEAQDFQGNTQWTTGAATPQDPAAVWPATGEITITQGQFILPIAVSKRELNYAPIALEALIRQRINMAAAKTCDKFILNADDDTSTNVNYSGGTPTSTLYYLQGNNWVRDTAIAASNTFDVGTLDASDFISVLALLDSRYADSLSDLLWIMPRNVYNKALLLDGVITRDKNSQATIESGKLGQIFWIDILVNSGMPSWALNTGKVHYSTGNSYGQFALVYKPSIQYGFGQPLEIQVQPVPGKGAIMYATFEFGFAIADNKAGLGRTVALGRNVTV